MDILMTSCPKTRKSRKQIFNFKTLFSGFVKEVTSAYLTGQLFDSFRKDFWLERDPGITGSISFESSATTTQSSVSSPSAFSSAGSVS
jgi:hypothetical protein